MFRRSGGKVPHDHDSDAEEVEPSSSSSATGRHANIVDTTTISHPQPTTSTSTSTTTIRRKRRRSTIGGKNSAGPARILLNKFRAARHQHPETSAIFMLGIMGCIAAGCILFVVLRLFAAFSSNNDSVQHHHSRHMQGRGGWKSQSMKDMMAARRDLNQRRHGPSSQSEQDDNAGEGGGDDDYYKALPWNPIYRIPDAYETVGDRSDWYAKLRKEMDPILPVDPDRSLRRLHELQSFQDDESGGDTLIGGQSYAQTSSGHHHSDQVLYDIYNCPDMPPPDYPFQWKLVDQLLHDWPADSVQVPQKIYNGLCIFDYTQDYDKAMRYRHAEVPFVVVNDPQVARTVERWAIPGYLEELMGDNVKHRAEYNTNNHFLYHQPPPRPPRRQRGRGGGGRQRGNFRGRNSRDEPEGLQDLYGRPAKLQREGTMPDAIRMTYKEWLSKANTTTPVGPDDEHWYFRLIGCGYMGADGSCDAGSSEYLFDELPFFQPKDNLYLGNGDKQKGIHCRFGMPGVIAENHFDGSRNSIVVLRGSRRYILSHPNQCDKLTLLPQGHPSARHSAVDYTNPDLEMYPEFAEATANEVVLQAGQVLYLPTNWFHFIVSLDLNMQCNTRSGITGHYQEPIERCGF